MSSRLIHDERSSDCSSVLILDEQSDDRVLLSWQQWLGNGLVFFPSDCASNVQALYFVLAMEKQAVKLPDGSEACCLCTFSSRNRIFISIHKRALRCNEPLRRFPLRPVVQPATAATLPQQQAQLEQQDEQEIDVQAQGLTAEQIETLSDSLAAISVQHTCCTPCNTATMSCAAAQAERDGILAQLGTAGITAEQALEARQRELDDSLCELFTLANEGRGMSRVDICSTLRIIHTLPGSVKPSFRTDRDYYTWVDRVLLSAEDGWQQVTIQVIVANDEPELNVQPFPPPCPDIDTALFWLPNHR
jgi:hypothetical protein